MKSEKTDGAGGSRADSLKHVFIVEDDASHAELIRRAFAAYADTYQLTVCTSLQEIRRSLTETVPDILVTDLLLPDGKGIELLPNSQEERHFPVVVMTSHGSQHTAVEAIKAGALDYVVKSDGALADMPHIVERALREWRYILERREAREHLRQAKEAAEAANRTKSEFLAIMSHELRTPLHIILGNAQLLRKGQNFSEDQQESIHTIYRVGGRLMLLLNDLLELSKFEAGQATITVEKIALLDFLDEIAEIFHIRAPQKDLSFLTEFSPNLPEYIYTDEKRLRQMLFNLLGNAVKFTKYGQVSFRVHALDALDEFTNALRFEIEDTGVGIPPDQVEKIFSTFHQVGDYLTRQGGPGLGLAVSQKFARMMGSNIHVRSTPGQGSLFWFDLPADPHERGE